MVSRGVVWFGKVGPGKGNTIFREKVKMKGKRIGIDLDGVVANWLAAAFAIMHFDHGIDLYPHVETWHPVDPEVNRLFGEIIRNKEVYKSLTPITGSVDGVHTLLEHFEEVHCVTHRPVSTRAITKQWLRKWGFPRLSVHHANGSKVDPAYTLGLTHFVDDNPDTIYAMRLHGITGYLLVVHEIPSQRVQRARDLPWIVPSWEKLLSVLVG